MAMLRVASLGLLALAAAAQQQPAAPPPAGVAAAANQTAAAAGNATSGVADQAPAEVIHLSPAPAAPPAAANAGADTNAGGGGRVVRILHISDTHNLHRVAEAMYPFPPADILIHTGDVSNQGTDAELAEFNSWLGSLKGRYQHILLITGNHDWIDTLKRVQSGQVPPADALSTDSMQAKLSNARLLNNELVEVMGLRIFGSSWSPWYSNAHPGDAPVGHEGWWDVARQNVFDTWLGQQQVQAQASAGSAPLLKSPQAFIPAETDILMTHHPARYILDENLGGIWGSSLELRAAIEQAKPRAHLFGHVHEQRGQFVRQADGTYRGGVEYVAAPGAGPFKCKGPPPAGYPATLISNNAVLNNGAVDKAATGKWGPARVAGPPRLITATWSGDHWSFAAQPAS